MRTKSNVAFLVGMLLLLVSSSDAAEVRKWTPTNGKEFDAEFVKVEHRDDGSNIVTLRKPDGNETQVRAGTLSKEDRKYTLQIMRSRKSEDDVKFLQGMEEFRKRAKSKERDDEKPTEPPAASVKAEMRTWTIDGKETEAIFVRFKGGKVVLGQPDGKQIRVAPGQLNEEDRKYIQDLLTVTTETEPMRKWTIDGKEAEAKFVRFTLWKGVFLEQPDGKKIRVPLPKLTKEDHQYVMRVVEPVWSQMKSEDNDQKPADATWQMAGEYPSLAGKWVESEEGQIYATITQDGNKFVAKSNVFKLEDKADRHYEVEGTISKSGRVTGKFVGDDGTMTGQLDPDGKTVHAHEKHDWGEGDFTWTLKESQRKPKPKDDQVAHNDIKDDCAKAQEAVELDTLPAFISAANANHLLLWKSAAEKGMPEAQFLYGCVQLYGVQCHKSPEEAFKWFRKAAEQGFVIAEHQLSECYWCGKGVPQDSTESLKWERNAAEHGCRESQYSLGCMYFNGMGVPLDVTEAVKWLRKSAEAGHPLAQYRLGDTYDHGVSNPPGVPRDNAEAVKWFRKAAEQGLSTAQYILGCHYSNGIGIAKDESEAAKWFRKSAEAGHRDAQYKLGVAYDQGQGVSKDHAEAVKWYRKAAKQGDEKAQNALIPKEERIERVILAALGIAEVGDTPEQFQIVVNSISERMNSGLDEKDLLPTDKKPSSLNGVPSLGVLYNPAGPHCAVIAFLKNQQTGRWALTMGVFQKYPEKTFLPGFKYGRPLESRIRGGDPNNLLIAPRNNSLKSVKCFATNEQLTIKFNIDRSKWNDLPILFPLLVRVFDKNGNYLTHFQTQEGFTVFSNVADILAGPYESQKQYWENRTRITGEVQRNAPPAPTVLKEVGNVLAYPVNVRDLRDAAIIEVGFVQVRTAP